MRIFIQCLVVVLAASWIATSAHAQEQPKYEVLKKMYDDAIGSLKEAQNKKNELATKNEELAKQVAELQKQLDATTKERDDLQRQATTYAEKTFNLRSFYASWHEFLKRYPALQAKWQVFLDAELLKGGNDAPALLEPEWPFRVEG
jgi:peptidoglycan hydrolase CwlO-like protein